MNLRNREVKEVTLLPKIHEFQTSELIVGDTRVFFPPNFKMQQCIRINQEKFLKITNKNIRTRCIDTS